MQNRLMGLIQWDVIREQQLKLSVISAPGNAARFAKPVTQPVIGVPAVHIEAVSTVCSPHYCHSMGLMARSGSHCFETRQDKTFPGQSAQKVHGGQWRVTVKVLHRSSQKVIYQSWPGLSEQSRRSVTARDPSELLTIHLSDRTPSNRDSPTNKIIFGIMVTVTSAALLAAFQLLCKHG